MPRPCAISSKTKTRPRPDELEQLAQVFLEQHLGTWYQAFAQGISQHAQLDFWRCYAQVLEDFLTSRLKNSGVETPTAKHH